MDDKYRSQFADFSPSAYRKALRLAKEKYEFCRFNKIGSAKSVLWRHDVDFSMEAAYDIAVIEAEEKVASTFFINPHSEYFNLLQLRNSDLLRQIRELGHAIGLHFDCHYYAKYSSNLFIDEVVAERKLIESIIGEAVDVLSYHNPTEAILAQDSETIGGMLNVYSPKFFKAIGYCSDSNGIWRFRRLMDVLEAAEESTLQVLTHPAFWVFENGIPPKQRIWRTIERHTDSLKAIYNGCLNQSQRENVGGDELFDRLEASLGSRANLLRDLFLVGKNREVICLLNGELDDQIRTLCIERLRARTQLSAEEIGAALARKPEDIEVVFHEIFDRDWTEWLSDQTSYLTLDEITTLRLFKQKARFPYSFPSEETGDAIRLFILAHNALTEATRLISNSKPEASGNVYELKEIPQWLTSSMV